MMAKTRRMKMKPSARGYIDDGDEEVEAVPAALMTRRPDPDPTLRTMQLVDKAISSLKDELETRFDAVKTRFEGIDVATRLVHDDYVRVPTVVDKATGSLRELMESRLRALEEGVQLRRENIAIRPEAVADAVKHLEILMESKVATLGAALSGRIEQLVGETQEKFTGVAAQFSERDTRTDQRAGDTKLAVDAAFAAAKEATSKIELGFTKQIDSMVLAMDTLSKNLDSKISDVKDMISDLKIRIQAVESRSAVIDPSIRSDLTNVMGEVRALASLEKMSAGRASVADPQIVALTSEVQQLRNLAQTGGGVTAATNAAAAISRQQFISIMGIIGVIIAAIVGAVVGHLVH